MNYLGQCGENWEEERSHGGHVSSISAMGRLEQEIMILGLSQQKKKVAWWAVEAKISSRRQGESGPDLHPVCFGAKRSKREEMSEGTDIMMDAERRGARGSGVMRSLEPVWVSQQQELHGEGNAPGHRGTARAGGQLLSAAGREDRRQSHTKPGMARYLSGSTSKSGSGSGKRNARDDLIQQKECGSGEKGLPKATGNQIPPWAAPKPHFHHRS